jgi:YVTN family beta-propeller protein
MKKMKGRVLILALLGAITALLPVQSGAAQGQYAYVTNEKDANLMVVDLKTEKVVAILPTGKVPHALVFTPGGKGYVNNRGERSLTVIDGVKMKVLRTIDLPATSMQIALSPGNKIMAVGYKDALKITLIDTATDTIITTLDIGPDRPGDKPVRIKHPFWSKDGRFVYAGDDLNMNLVKIDAGARKIAATIPLHATTHHLSTAPDGKIYIAHGKDTNGALHITVFDAASDQVIKTIPIPLAPGEKADGHHGTFTPDGKFFYFCNEGGRTLAIIDTAKLTVVKTLQVGEGAGHAYFSHDGKKAFVVCHADNVVSVIDTATQQVIKNVEAGTGKKQGHSGYIGEDGSFYMLNAADGTINRIDGQSLTLRSWIRVGAQPMIMVVR